MNAQTNQFVDVYDTWYQPWWHSKIVYISVTLVLLGLFAVIAYLTWKRFIVNKPLPYDEVTILQLQKLKSNSYETEAEFQDGYFALTMILKNYLSKRYNVSLLNKTDNEIVEHIKSLVPVDIFATLQEFFERSFHIKFAQAKASEKMLCDDISFALTVVKQTKQEQNGGKYS